MADWTLDITDKSVTKPTSADGSHTGRGVTLATLAATAIAGVGFLAFWLVRVHGDDPGYIDLLVYRAGGHAVFTGHSIYAADFAAVNQSPMGLAFTYPPFAALLFVPLAALPAVLAKVLMIVLNAAACTIFFAVILVAGHAARDHKWDRLRGRHALTAPISAKTGIVVFAAAVIFLLSVPVEHNFAYGQVNLILAAAVALDIVPPHVPWPRGLLVGLAAAIKLTPAVFVGYFLVTRQWRALAVAAATAASAVILGWLVDPSDTIRYFASTAFHPARIGGLAYSSNQSMWGVIERIPALDTVHGVVWVVSTVLVVALAVVAIEVSRRCTDTAAAMLSAAFIGLLCSPVSWGHHWVWLPAAAVYLLARWNAVGENRNLVAGLAVALVTLAPPWMFLPNSDGRERQWNPFEHLLGSVWALTALVLLAWFALARTAPRGAAEVTHDLRNTAESVSQGNSPTRATSTPPRSTGER